MACAPRWKTPRGTSEAPSHRHRHRPAMLPEWLTHCQRSARQQPVRCTPRCGHNRPRPAHHLLRRPHSTGNAADTPTLASSEAALRKSCLQRSARQPAHPMHAAHPGGAKPTSPHTPTIDRTHTPPSRRISAAARLDGPCCRGPPTQGRWSGPAHSNGCAAANHPRPVQHTPCAHTHKALPRQTPAAAWQPLPLCGSQPWKRGSTGCVAANPPPGRRNSRTKLADNMCPLDAALPCFPVAACPSLPLLPPRWHTSVRWVSGRPPPWWSRR